MSYIHSKGIAHLDLKTTNILLSADRRSTVIADFGISQTLAGFGGFQHRRRHDTGAARGERPAEGNGGHAARPGGWGKRSPFEEEES